MAHRVRFLHSLPRTMKFVRTFACLAALASCAGAEKILVFAGTYTRTSSKGIYSFRFDTATGAVTEVKLAVETSNPSFLALHPNGNWLYAVNEIADFGGAKSGSVTAFAIDATAGTLKAINTVATRGENPAHLGIDPSGRWLIAANYSGGSVAVFPIGADGALGESSNFLQRSGSSVHPRQKGPHPHEVVFAAPGLMIPDLGTDEVVSFHLSEGKLKTAGSARFDPGFGPRHLALGSRGQFAYVLGEIESAISVRALPGFEEKQKISLLPKDFNGRNTAAEITLHPNGRFLFASNRGLDEIVAFTIGADGLLSQAGKYSTLGKTPRNFAIDPSGNYLLVANQDSDSIAVFRVDQRSGKLTATGAQIAVPIPVCVLFADRRP